MAFYGGTIIEREKLPFSEPSRSSRLFKKVVKYSFIPAAILGGFILCYQLDRDIDRISQRIYDEHLHNAKVLIPQHEKNLNYSDAQALENEAWTYLRRAKKGDFRASMKQLEELEILLNSNNTLGTKYGESID